MMRALDFLIILLFAPSVIFGAGYLYMFQNKLCGPVSSIFCLGFNWIADVFVIPLVVFSFAIGLFFLCKRCRTEEI